MKRRLLSVVITFLLATPLFAQQPWVSAYYAGWMQSYCPPSAIDFGAVTHIMHFSINPDGGSTISWTGNGITASASSAIIQAAHAANKKVLVTCGGWGDASAFAEATNGTNRAAFIANLVNFVVGRGYDGIDIDWEPISNTTQFKLFMPELRAALDAAKPGLLLTMACMDGNASHIAAVQNSIDQINIMTYDMSGAWQGWVVWHNAPIYDGGYKFPGTNSTVPSANADVDDFVKAGIAKSRIGIGADFYGYVWSGVTAPRQTWSSTPSVSDNVPYYQIMNTYGSQPVLWDSIAHAAYISVSTGTGKFVSLDDARTMQAKADYIRSKGIGGIILWELGGGYRSNQPAGQRDLLLQAVKTAFFSPSTAVESAPTNVSAYRLDQNYPNPFNPETSIRFHLAAPGTISLRVFDVLGREAALLASGHHAAGEHTVRFDASRFASGVYIVRLDAGAVLMTRPMSLVR